MNNVTRIYAEGRANVEPTLKKVESRSYEGKSDFWFLGYVTGCAFAWLMFVVGCITTALYVWGQIARMMK